MSAPTVSTTPPKQGGIHSIYGVCLGVSGLNNDYYLAKVNPYKFTSQLRNVKQTGISERTLINSRENSSLRKFNGKLEIPNTITSSKMDKEEFIESLKDKISSYGLHTFYYLPGPEKKMISLLSNLHTFSLHDTISEYEERLVEPNRVESMIEVISTKTTESISDRFRAFDAYEIFDLTISRLVVESLVTASFR